MEQIINNYISLIKALKNLPTSETITCKCEECGKTFTMDYSTRRSRLRSLHKIQKVRCHECAKLIACRDNLKKGKEALYEQRHQKKIKNHEEFTKIEQDSIKNTIINSYQDLIKFKENGGRACTCVCTRCNKHFIIENKNNLTKYIYRNKNYNEDMLCRECKILIRREPTNIKEHGHASVMQNDEIKSRALSHKGMTSPEIKMNDFLTNRGFNFQYEYNCNGKNYDFAVFKDNKLAMLIEIDGEYFHGLTLDGDGAHIHGETDCNRFNKCPEGVKLIICDSCKIEQAFEEILNVFNLSYKDWIQSIIDNLPLEFPYPVYSDIRLKQDYKRLCTYETINKKGYLANSTILNFHKSLWHAHRQKLPSPYEAWNNKILLERCVKNRFIYSSNLTTQNILNGFNICKIAPRVSVFSASLAKYLILKYLNDVNIIFDPFSGFSGRLLGTCACNKQYIGQDINKDHVKEANEIKDYHNLNASIKCQDIITDTKNIYESLFTCPPYGGLERWNYYNDEIEKSCDEWINICLEKYDCKKYLFVVDKTEKYKNYIIETLPNRSHLYNYEEKVILIKK